MPGGSTMSNWNTAYPNGEAIYVSALRNADQRAALARATDADAAVLPNRAHPVLPAPRSAGKVSVFVWPTCRAVALPPANAA